MRITAGRLLTLADQAATFLFAVEGALAAVLVGLDLFGILVIAFVTALVGGIIRDLLIGSTPPASLRGASYPTIAFAGAVAGVRPAPGGAAATDRPAALVGRRRTRPCSPWSGLPRRPSSSSIPLVAALLGMVSAVGGGVVRDILLNIVPNILRTDIYAVAAFCGAGTTVIALRLGASRAVAMAAGIRGVFPAADRQRVAGLEPAADRGVKAGRHAAH